MRIKGLLPFLAAIAVSCAQNSATDTSVTSDFIGIDVSHHNGTIDWEKVPQNHPPIQFVYIKATEGATVKDNRYITNVKGARKAGLKVGAYHYFRMTSGSHEQFRNFSESLDSAPFDLIPMVDVETCDKASVQQTRDSLKVFLDLVEERYGVVPMIYGTNRSYNTIYGDSFDDGYPLYIGRYGTSEPVVKGKSRYTIWQYSEKGSVNGIEKPVDLCRFNSASSIEDIMMPEKHREYVTEERHDDLVIYTPDFTRIDLVTGKMPSKDDKTVIFVCEAAFTGECLDEFKHSNIAGDHVSGGEFFKGYKCGPNNGVFTWDGKDGWHFYNYGYKNAQAPLRQVASQGGMGFCQSLLFLDGKRFKGCFKYGSMNKYRAVCELDGKLCIIDCAKDISFSTFLDELEELGVKNAIYCDMGWGWNYSWYRKADGNVKEIYSYPGQYTTNWITFYNE